METTEFNSEQKTENEKSKDPQTTHRAGTYPVYVSDAAEAERMKMENYRTQLRDLKKRKKKNQKTPKVHAGTYPAYVSDAAQAQRMKMENTELSSENKNKNKNNKRPQNHTQALTLFVFQMLPKQRE